jgi:hypothetical protein
MAFIETIPASNIDDEVRAMYERQQAHYGYVPNYAKVFCYRPAGLSQRFQKRINCLPS